MAAPAFSFGTAGIRARAGAADHELNARTVAFIAGAVLDHLATLGPDARERGVCVGFDGRADSASFAQVVAHAAGARGFLVRAFAEPVPTPLLAFATRLHGAVGGMMITASHNPPADNGIKLYLAGGAQVAGPHDAAIEARLRGDVEGAPSVALQASAELAPRMLGQHEEDAYLAGLCAFLAPEPELSLPVLAYTASCGVGTQLTRRLLAQAGATAHEVAEQAAPRADFGGLASPNPEHEEALSMLRALAEHVQAEVAFAHDPDADRLAVLARSEAGTLRALSGDEVGALLCDFLLARAAHPAEELVATTHVSSDFMARIAEARGAHVIRTNTGFKHITRGARAAAAERGAHLLFSYEEAIGYAFGDLGDDKDGVAALHVMLALLRHARAEGQTLMGRLDALCVRHGVHATRQLALMLPTGTGAEERDALLARFATDAPDALLGAPGTYEDHRHSPEPAALLVLRAADGARICVRPSGTEPKLKLYLHAHAPVEGMSRAALDDARARADARLDGLAARVRGLLSAP